MPMAPIAPGVPWATVLSQVRSLRDDHAVSHQQIKGHGEPEILRRAVRASERAGIGAGVATVT